ncbi:hypothetical protein B7P43_G17634 [Cryptotermes secundus]|uniref:Zinc finger CCCH domain-containing protein 3 n=1 Tax=Cryptotermes secundus TaxID=105785 RepID=A0A2J7PMD3_9NEOP|nr:hypothetical protein B7P43_G17634 [Cryptotermes secundus]
MAYRNQPSRGQRSSFHDECDNLFRLIERRKRRHEGKGTTSFDSQTATKIECSNRRSRGSGNAAFSKYRKINVNTRDQDPLVDRRSLCTENERSLSRKTTLVSRGNSVLYTPRVSGIHESQSQNFAASSYPCQNVSDFKSGRMYLNPHFLKENSRSESSVVAEYIASGSKDISKLKHSVHINPKVLAEQSMKATTQSQGTQPHTSELPLEPSGINFPTTKYVHHSRTKLVKQNAVPSHPTTSNMVRNSGTTSQPVSKKLSPVNKSSPLGPLMFISRTKLVCAKSRGSNQGLQGLENNRPSVPVPSAFTTRHKVVRRQSTLSWSRSRRNSARSSEVAVKAAKAVCSEHKVARSSATKSPITKSRYTYVANKVASGEESKYKIDRRLHKSPKTLKTYSLQYEMLKRGRSNQRNMNSKVGCKYRNGQYPFRSLKFANKTWSNSTRLQKLMVVNKKLRKIGNSPDFGKGREQGRNEHSLNLVRIGGVLYRASKMKLTQSVTPKCRSHTEGSMANHNIKRSKTRSSSAVYIRGNKFLMDASGRTMVRAAVKPTKSGVNEPSMANVPLKRIDIGGVTFVPKSPNVLVRTNAHNARNYLSQAKQKSIALLTSNLRKSNQPCIFYHRFGKCVRKDKGTCPHVHDPKYIAICKNFLRGSCEAGDCTLSHDVGPEKMPTCKYFLEGCCVRDNCPYLHVKVSAKADICKNFLCGYCPDGQECKKRHTYLCPEFEKAGSCSKGKSCPYPHKTIVEKKVRAQKHTVTTDEAHSTRNERKRYYEAEETVSVEIDAEPQNPQVTNQVDSSDLNVKRLKLLKKVDDMKQAMLNEERLSDEQMDGTPSESQEPKI